MRANLSDIKKLHSKALHENPERRHPDIADMLVIDHIEEHLFEHRHEISKFDHEETVVREKFPDIASHGLDIIDVSEHIVSADRVRFAVFRRDLPYRFFSEITVERRDTSLIRIRGKVLGRLHSNPAHSRFFIARNKKTVVTANINGERLLFSGKPSPHISGIFRKMSAEGLGRRTDIEVFVEHQRRGNRMGKLHEVTFRTLHDRERTMKFRFCRIRSAGKVPQAAYRNNGMFFFYIVRIP